jgi:hypothetical protein
MEGGAATVTRRIHNLGKTRWSFHVLYRRVRPRFRGGFSGNRPLWPLTPGSSRTQLSAGGSGVHGLKVSVLGGSFCVLLKSGVCPVPVSRPIEVPLTF